MAIGEQQPPPSQHITDSCGAVFRSCFVQLNATYMEEMQIMTHIFALTNHKGGVGKSTSATNLAHGILMVMEKAGVNDVFPKAA